MARTRKTQHNTRRLAERFLGVFRELQALTQDETPDEVVARLSLNQLRTLNLIYRKPGISQKELAEQLQVTPASVSIWISQMQKTDLVQKSPSEADSRVMCLYLGSAGRDLVEKVEATQTEAIAALLSALPVDEQQFVVEALERALAVSTAQVRDGEPVPAKDA